MGSAVALQIFYAFNLNITGLGISCHVAHDIWEIVHKATRMPVMTGALSWSDLSS